MRICFVCLGNICRSPMAEFIMKDKLEKLNISGYEVASRATSYEETGNDLYPPVKEILRNNSVPFTKHSAKRLEKEDYDKYDLFICMEESNISNTLRIFDLDKSKKIIKLLDKDINDPWYSRDFQTTFNEITLGINKLLEKEK